MRAAKLIEGQLDQTLYRRYYSLLLVRFSNSFKIVIGQTGQAQPVWRMLRLLPTCNKGATRYGRLNQIQFHISHQVKEISGKIYDKI